MESHLDLLYRAKSHSVNAFGLRRHAKRGLSAYLYSNGMHARRSAHVTGTTRPKKCFCRRFLKGTRDEKGLQNDFYGVADVKSTISLNI